MALRAFDETVLTDIDFVEKYLSIEEQFIRSEKYQLLKCDKKTFLYNTPRN